MMIKKRRIVADDEIDTQIDDTVVDEGAGDVEVEPEATDLLFETEDVAQLLAEATGEDVDVTVDDEETGEVTFGVGDQELTVTPDGDEEVLESCKTPKKPVKANTRRVVAKRTVKASTSKRVVKKARPRK